jgi:hypothetical protein
MGLSLIDDADFAQELHLHLQSIGEYYSSEDIIRYVACLEILEKLGQTTTVYMQQHTGG